MAFKFVTKPEVKVGIDFAKSGEVSVLAELKDNKVVNTVVLPKVKVQPVSEVEAMTQEYIGLYRKLEEIGGKDLLKRMEDLRKKLVAKANEHFADDQVAVLKCEDGEVEFSARGKEAEVKNPTQLLVDLNKNFSPEIAMSVVKIAMTPLRKVLSELELKEYLEEKPGSRTLKEVRPATKVE